MWSEETQDVLVSNEEASVQDKPEGTYCNLPVCCSCSHMAHISVQSEHVFQFRSSSCSHRSWTHVSDKQKEGIHKTKSNSRLLK